MDDRNVGLCKAVRRSVFCMVSTNSLLCGLHEVYSHIMLRPNLFIYLSTRVEGLSRGLVSAILVAKGFNSSMFVLVIVSRVSCLRISQQIQTRLVL